MTGFFISGAEMISNDYFDLEVDKVNHPKKHLPSGRITAYEVAGFISAAFLGALALALAVVIWAVGMLYNWRYKESGLPGNMMVSFSVAMTFFFGGL